MDNNSTRAGGGQHGQGRLVLLPPLEALQELLLALQQTEGPAEARVEDVMDTCHMEPQRCEKHCYD